MVWRRTILAGTCLRALATMLSAIQQPIANSQICHGTLLRLQHRLIPGIFLHAGIAQLLHHCQKSPLSICQTTWKTAAATAGPGAEGTLLAVVGSILPFPLALPHLVQQSTSLCSQGALFLQGQCLAFGNLAAGMALGSGTAKTSQWLMEALRKIRESLTAMCRTVLGPV